jgi:hypothetical protein
MSVTVRPRPTAAVDESTTEAEGDVYSCGDPGDVYVNISGGAGQTLWVKESGIGTNTGWAAK